MIGVGVNPAAPDLERELKRFAWKVEAGAEYAITQPVFDLDQLDRFLERVESFRIPIVAGIWPLVSLRNAEFLANEVPGVSGAGCGAGPDARGERRRQGGGAGRRRPHLRGRCSPPWRIGCRASRCRRRSAGCRWRSRCSEAAPIEPAGESGYTPPT